MRIHLTKSIAFGEGYVTTLTDDGDSLGCQPFTTNQRTYDEKVDSFKNNPSLKVVPIDSKEGFEQSYFITE